MIRIFLVFVISVNILFAAVKDIEKKIDIQVEKIIEKAGLVKAEDLEEIKKRLRAIEDKLEKSD